MTDMEKEFPRIVVGIDGSAESENALRWANRLAPTLGAHIRTVIAWQCPPVVGSELGPVPYFPDAWDPRDTAQRIMERTVSEVFKTTPPDGFSQLVLEGSPVRVLLEASAGATLLVLGSRGLGGFAGMLLGSVSRACAEHAKCPVLVVHRDDL